MHTLPKDPFAATAWRSNATVSPPTQQSLRELGNITSPSVALVAGAYITSLPVLSALGVFCWRYSPSKLLGILACMVVLVVLARQMRALECLVHEASHYNFNRRDKIRNDWLANLLCAWPMLSHVENYRRTHLDHHKRIGTAQDVCHQRYVAHRMDRLNRSNAGRFILGLIKIYPGYNTQWFRSIGSDRKAAANFVIWHGIFIAAGAIAYNLTPYAGDDSAIMVVLSLWLLYFLIPFAFVLPILRMIGEAGEHPYEQSWNAKEMNVVDGTVNNIGLIHRLLIHPFGDGYHLMHHLFPAIPGHRLAKAYAILKAEGGAFARMKQRTAILQAPITLS